MLRDKENTVEPRRIGFTRRSFLRIGALYGLTLAAPRRLSVCLTANDARGAVFCNFSGNAPRPFYLIGHGSNSIHLAREYLASGANALEADVNVYRSRPNQLCVDHGSKLTATIGRYASIIRSAVFLSHASLERRRSPPNRAGRSRQAHRGKKP